MNKPLLSFGVIADTQYADADDAWDYRKTSRRLYRNSFTIFQKAVHQFNEANTKFNIQIGDLLDGKAKPKREEALTRILNEIQSNSKTPCNNWYFPVGNHELYNFSFDELREMKDFNTHPFGEPYYSFKVEELEGWKMVVLNPYGISTIGRAADHPVYSHAQDIIHKNNPNIGVNDDWTSGLIGVERRFVPYNGAIEDSQLAWLNEELRTSESINEKVIVFTHVPIFPGSCSDSAILWNYTDVLEILHRYHVVVAVFSGHDHDGGYSVDDHNIHHITLAAPLECKIDEVAYGVVEIYANKLELIGYGKVQSLSLPFPESNSPHKK